MDFLIRWIQPEDNGSIKNLVVKVLLEHGAKGEGFASSDPELDCMFETYQNAGARYWVIEKNNEILGVGGIGPLKGESKEYCELQKMYFLKELRGNGLGKKLMTLCLEFAINYGYSYCYLETLPNMKTAQNMYKNYNFRDLENRMGITGHSSCPVFMLLDLTNKK